MKLMKLSIVALAVALSLTAVSTASAEVWRMATKMPVDSPEGKVFQRFADLTKQYSDEALEIQIFPNEQLGKEDAVLEQLQSNVVQIYAEGFGFMKKWADEIAWTAPSYVFDDRAHWSRFMTSDLVRGWFEKIEEASGVTVLGDPTRILRGPFLAMVSTKPVNDIEDIAGIRLRMHPDQLAIATWSHIGAEVITLPWTEVYQGLDKGIVEAVISPFALIESMRFNEVAKYIARTDAFSQSIGFMVNAKALADLDEVQRNAIMRAYDEAGTFSAQLMEEVTNESLEKMKKAGASYVELDSAPFIARMESFYAEMDAAGKVPDGFFETVAATRE